MSQYAKNKKVQPYHLASLLRNNNKIDCCLQRSMQKKRHPRLDLDGNQQSERVLAIPGRQELGRFV